MEIQNETISLQEKPEEYFQNGRCQMYVLRSFTNEAVL